MALWEIRIANQEPVRVDIEEERNLSEEYADLEAYHDSLRWRFWRRASPYWKVTDAVVIHKDVVVGVLPKKPKVGKPPIGFY
jgi:hypothetical protein